MPTAAAQASPPAQAAARRTVTFVSPPSVVSPFGNTPRLRKHHQEDPSDPFIAHTEVFYFILVFINFLMYFTQNTASFETFQLSAVYDSDEDTPYTPQRPHSPVSPTATPSRRQRRAQKKTLGPAGNRRFKRAEDVLSFFVINKDKTKTCSFCV